MAGERIGLCAQHGELLQGVAVLLLEHLVFQEVRDTRRHLMLLAIQRETAVH